MTLTEILPSLRQLNHKEKVKAIQFLANEIAIEDDTVFENGSSCAVHSVFDSFEAADDLTKLLEEENAKLKTV